MIKKRRGDFDIGHVTVMCFTDCSVNCVTIFVMGYISEKNLKIIPSLDDDIRK